MTTSLLIQILIAVLGSTLVSALVVALFNRKKTGSEASKNTVDAQATIIKDVLAENKRLSEQNNELRLRMDNLEDKFDRIELEKDELEVWARRVYNVMNEEQRVLVGEPPNMSVFSRPGTVS